MGTRVGSDGLDRRRFLSLAGAAGAAVALRPAGGVSLAAPAATKPARVAKNLIFMVADGMAAGTLQLADMFSRRAQGRASYWVSLIEREEARRSVVRTSSADSLVTDSAAASTAWSIGELVNNGAIGLTPDGRMPEPILMRARRSGRAIGLVTTTRLTHATPAGFLVNSPLDRDREDVIAEQMVLERLPEVALGGGGKFITPDLVAARGVGTVAIARNRAELRALDLAAETRPILGVFNESHMSWELDRRHQPPESGEPSLAEMTRWALGALGGKPGGFALQIEGGRVDHAGHENDAGSLIAEQIAFDEALGAALEWTMVRDDTLLIVTSDHATANPGLTDYGRPGNEGFEKLAGATRSFEWIAKQVSAMGESPDIDGVADVVRRATGVQLAARDLAMLTRRLAGEPVDPFEIANAKNGVLGSLLANHYKVAFLSVNHTSDFVELTAIGPGSELVPPTMRICDVHRVLTGAMGV